MRWCVSAFCLLAQPILLTSLGCSPTEAASAPVDTVVVAAPVQPDVALAVLAAAPMDERPAATGTPPLAIGVPPSGNPLDELVGPVALYPDPLLAQILTAATYPLEIVQARRWLDTGGTEDLIEAQSWDSSVKAVARYPEVLRMMDDRIAWTSELGSAVMADRSAVMDSVQQLRTKARSLGHLVDSPEQRVIESEGIVRVVPATTEFIYVPVYSPRVVFVQPCVTPVIVFRPRWFCGPWLSLDCDWYSRRIYYHGCHSYAAWDWYSCRPWVSFYRACPPPPSLSINIHIGDNYISPREWHRDGNRRTHPRASFASTPNGNGSPAVREGSFAGATRGDTSFSGPSEAIAGQASPRSDDRAASFATARQSGANPASPVGRAPRTIDDPVRTGSFARPAKSDLATREFTGPVQTPTPVVRGTPAPSRVESTPSPRRAAVQPDGRTGSFAKPSRESVTSRQFTGPQQSGTSAARSTPTPRSTPAPRSSPTVSPRSMPPVSSTPSAPRAPDGRSGSFARPGNASREFTGPRQSPAGPR